MSKIELIRNKYLNINNIVFTKMVNSDKTETKKYLDYMCKMVNNKLTTPATIVKYVNKFDELLPYIPNKDIYSQEYLDINTLKNTIINAETLKEEKTFIKDEHVLTIYENDEILLIQPLTHRGSVKYGSNTKWCTTYKNNPDVFKRYFDNGYLCYLINKQLKTYNKVALYFTSKNVDPLNGHIEVYNATDNRIENPYQTLMKNGWTSDNIFTAFFTFRLNYSNHVKTFKDKKIISDTIQILSNINIDKINTAISNLNNSEENKKFIDQFKNNINEIISTLNKNLK